MPRGEARVMDYGTLSRAGLASLVPPGPWTDGWEHVWQIREAFAGHAWGEKAAVCYCDKRRPFGGGLNPSHVLLMV